MLTQLLLATGLAILVSALCSIAEAALFSLPLSYIEVLAKSGRKSGALLRIMKKDIAKPITAILTLNTIANTMGAAIAGASAAAYLGEQYIAWFSVAFTLAILFFSEIVPKTAGVVYCKPLALWLAYPLFYLVKILWPIVWVINRLTKLIEKSNKQTYISAQEIQAIASLSQEYGEIDYQEKKIIINILELKNKMVRKVMTPRTVAFTLSKHMTVAEAAELQDKWSLHSRVPVYDLDSDDIVGIVLAKHVLMKAVEGEAGLQLGALMEPPHFVPETAPLPRILHDFFEHRQHLFVVVDEYGGFTGVISLEDIIEEIMGEEIMDESDKTRDMRALARFQRMALRAKDDHK